MVTLESAILVINQHGGCLDTATGKLKISSKALESGEIKKAVHVLKEAGPDKVKAVLSSVQTSCQGCPYHDTGPDSFGTGEIHWCGPWKKSDGERWFNIAGLAACPIGKWGLVNNTIN